MTVFHVNMQQIIFLCSRQTVFVRIEQFWFMHQKVNQAITLQLSQPDKKIDQ